MVGAGQRSVADMDAMKITLDGMRDHLADFDDAVQPVPATISIGKSTLLQHPGMLGDAVGVRRHGQESTFQRQHSHLQTDMTAMIGGMDEWSAGWAI